MRKASTYLKLIAVTMLAFSKSTPIFADSTESTDKQIAHIAALFDSLKTSTTDSAKHNLNNEITANFGHLLAAEDSSFFFPLQELPYMGKCYSDDGELRIYTWNYPLANKTFGYGGFIQFKPQKKKKQNANPIALTIREDAYVPQKGAKIATNNWYGALYYKAIKSKKDGNDYYVLFGWSRNDALTDLKTIETLKISQNHKTATLGGTNAFYSKGKTTNRILLQYNNSAKVTLDYDEAEKKIVMDHLSPSDPFYKDIFSYYGPDFSYDAYFFDKKSGTWKLQEDIDQKNKD